MKKIFIITFTCLCATAALSFAAPDMDTLLKNEKAAWKAFKDRQADAFRKVVSANEVSVYDDGFYDLDGEISGMKNLEMKSFTISDYKVKEEGPDLAITTYKVTVKLKANGKWVTNHYNAASVWQMKNGQWQAIFHTNITAAQPKT